MATGECEELDDPLGASRADRKSSYWLAGLNGMVDYDEVSQRALHPRFLDWPSVDARIGVPKTGRGHCCEWWRGLQNRTPGHGRYAEHINLHPSVNPHL